MGCFSYRFKFLFFVLFFLAVQLASSGKNYADNSAFELQTAPDKTFTISYSINHDETSGAIQLTDYPVISGLGLNGQITLIDDSSFVRIILVDQNFNEYLIYETSALLSQGNTITLKKSCEETESLDNIQPSFIRIESANTSIYIQSLSIVKASTAKLARSKKNTIKEDQRKAKIAAINRSLNKKNKKWIAGETSISKLSYSEKKALLGGTLPNMNGFEYYVGGIFEIPSSTSSDSGDTLPQSDTAQASPYVDEFTWQNRHGQNWVTPVKSQGGCGSCWAFAATGSTELLVNLYYNKHLDLDLAEQDAVSCSGAGSCSGGLPGRALNYYASTGVVNEEAFPYKGKDENDGVYCDDKGDVSERIIIGGKTTFNRESEDKLKQYVIQGPVSFGLYSWSHAITLVGYKVLKEGDKFYVYTQDSSGTVTIGAGDDLIGKTSWIIKNSWGSWWGDNGYAHVVTDLSNIGWTHSVKGPVKSLNYTDDDIACVDSDHDGYYTWGIGSKPDTCPSGSPAEADGDDSDPDMGPMDEYGHLQQITDTVSITSPSEKAFVSDGSEIEFKASAVTISSPVNKVEFYLNSQLIGEDNNNPYSFTLTNIPNGSYSLYAKAYLESGKSIVSDTISFTVTGPLGEGSISHFVWKDISGTSIDSLTGNSAYPDHPSVSETITSFEIPSNFGDNYGTRVVGYLTPPVSGDYTFKISGDDNCELWLSSNDTQETKELIASVPGWTSSREWTKFAAQTSVTVPLIQGNRYFIEALHKEGSGGDNLAVGWTIPGYDFDVIDGKFLSPIENQPEVHIVTFYAGYNGSINGEAIQSVVDGEDSSYVTAVPDTGYLFSGWTGDITSDNAKLNITNVTKDMTVTAGFTKIKYRINFLTSGNGTLSGDTVQDIPYLESSNGVTPIPDTGYHFEKWTGDYVGNDSPLEISSVTSDMTITAKFTKNVYTINFVSDSGGSIQGDTIQSITYGENCSSVTAVAGQNYEFTGWSGDINSSEPVLNINSVKSDMTITAHFSLKKFSVTFVAEDGGTIDGPSSQTIEYGSDAISVTAESKTGYIFKGWYGDMTSNNAALAIKNITEDMTITAKFTAEIHTVIFTAGEGGTIEGDPNQEVTYGKSFSEIKAVPKEGYHFVNWTGDIDDDNQTLSPKKVTKDISVKANFEINTYTLIVQASENGKLEGATTQTIKYGESSKKIIAIPDDNYKFSGWEGDYTGSEASLSIEKIKSDMMVKAVFTETKDMGAEEDNTNACFISSVYSK